MNNYYSKLNKVNGGFKIDSLRNIFETDGNIKKEMYQRRNGKKFVQEFVKNNRKSK